MVETSTLKLKIPMSRILDSLGIDKSKVGVLIKAGFDPLASFDNIVNKELVLTFEREEDLACFLKKDSQKN